MFGVLAHWLPMQTCSVCKDHGQEPIGSERSVIRSHSVEDVAHTRIEYRAVKHVLHARAIYRWTGVQECDGQRNHPGNEWTPPHIAWTP